MDFKSVNIHLAEGRIDEKGVLPHLDQLKGAPFVFKTDFGLKELPKENGILLIRGARQYGKSTWLEENIHQTINEFGPGTAFYLNGEDISDAGMLEHEFESLVNSFAPKVPVKRIFIDEITAITKWEIVLKKLADKGKLRDILVVTTGSKATDLRRGSERLPGRKGRLSRTNYLFTPISFYEFKRVCGSVLQSKTLLAYLLSGGSPIACAELASTGNIPEYAIELTRDWIEGEIALSGRNRSSLYNILNSLFRFANNPLGQAKLARESGLANNTVAAGYIEILNDLGCVTPCYPFDFDRKILILRKECKYHFMNLLTALSYHSARIRSVNDFLRLPEKEQGAWYEWLIAQELQRRRAIAGSSILTPLAFWQNKDHEIDFVEEPTMFIEIKRGKSSPLEFSWFTKQFPRHHLTVLSSSQFNTNYVSTMSIEEFLLSSF